MSSRRRSRPAHALSGLLLLAVLVLVLFPFAWTVSTALKPESEVLALPPQLVTPQQTVTNFSTAWSFFPFGRDILNSIVVATLGTVLVLATSAPAAYAFARLSFRGRDTLFLVYVATLVIPQEVTVIPLFVLMKSLGWTDSYQALIVPPAFTAFGTFLLRQFFRGIPRELEDAARLDGASRLVILARIMLPLARPALGALGVFTFIGYWNSFLWPLIIVNSADKATVPLGLDMFVTQTVARWNLLAAASLISAAPSLLLVIVLQRSFVRGIVIAGFGGR